jgi:aromatic-L-amino-acid/L-tryptophan decarboxylase
VLELPPDEMRRLGYRAVDRLVDHLEGPRELPPIRTVDPANLPWLLEPCPEEPSDPEAALDLAFDEALTFGMQASHPRLFARVPSPSGCSRKPAGASWRASTEPTR